MLVLVPPLSIYLAYVAARLAAQEAIANDNLNGHNNGRREDGDSTTVDNNHINGGLGDNRSSLNDPLLPPASAVVAAGLVASHNVGVGSPSHVNNTPPSPNLSTDPLIQRNSEQDDTPAATVEIRGLIKTFSKGGSRRTRGKFTALDRVDLTMYESQVECCSPAIPPPNY